MVKWKDSEAEMRQKPTLELADIRLNLYNLLQKSGLPADLLADIFYWKGVIDLELMIRAGGERLPDGKGGWRDVAPGGHDLT